MCKYHFVCSTNKLIPTRIGHPLQSSTADQELVHKVNTSIVFSAFRLYAPISRAELAVKTGLSRSTVSSIINSLIDQGLVLESELQNSKVGRPAILLVLNPRGGAVVGIEIGVAHISIILTDFVASVLWRRRIELASDLNQLDMLQKAEGLIEEALAVAYDKGLRPLGIGLGVPGLVDNLQGKLIFAPNLRWENVPFRLMWTQRFHLPIYIENEANAAALGEYYFGAAAGVENILYLSSDVGLGGGILIDGRLFCGSRGYASEVGHMRMEPNGEKCACGRVGCWETQVGPRAVLKRVRAALDITPDSKNHHLLRGNLDNLTFQMVVDAALDGDPLCVRAMEEVAVNLGMGIADLVNIFNPDLVVLGGALSRGETILMPVIKETVMHEALFTNTSNLNFTASAHGADAAVLGAVAMVLDVIFREVAIV